MQHPSFALRTHNNKDLIRYVGDRAHIHGSMGWQQAGNIHRVCETIEHLDGLGHVLVTHPATCTTGTTHRFLRTRNNGYRGHAVGFARLGSTACPAMRAQPTLTSHGSCRSSQVAECCGCCAQPHHCRWLRIACPACILGSSPRLRIVVSDPRDVGANEPVHHPGER